MITSRFPALIDIDVDTQQFVLIESILLTQQAKFANCIRKDHHSSFACRVISVWNSMPDTVCFSSLASFSQSLKDVDLSFVYTQWSIKRCCHYILTVTSAFLMNFNTSCTNGNVNGCSTIYLLSNTFSSGDKILIEDGGNVKKNSAKGLLMEFPDKAAILNTSREKTAHLSHTQTHCSVE